MAFQWDRSVLGQSLTVPRDPGCRLDTIIAIARQMHPRGAPSDFQAWSVEGWQFGGPGLRMIDELSCLAPASSFRRRSGV